MLTQTWQASRKKNKKKKKVNKINLSTMYESLNDEMCGGINLTMLRSIA